MLLFRECFQPISTIDCREVRCIDVKVVGTNGVIETQERGCDSMNPIANLKLCAVHLDFAVFSEWKCVCVSVPTSLMFINLHLK